MVKGGDGEVRRVDAHTKVWAAGVQASPLARMMAEATGAECDRAGRIAVLPDCSLPGHPEVFAIGDMMSLDGLPGVAEVAMQQGIHAARTIAHRVRGEEGSKPFKYRDLGSMATISRFRAIVSFKGIRVAGFLGWLMWLFVHLAFLTGFKNRFTTVLSWGLTFIGGRGASGRSPPSRSSPGLRSPRRGQPFLLRLATEDRDRPKAGTSPPALPGPASRSRTRRVTRRWTTSAVDAPTAIIATFIPSTPSEPQADRSRRARSPRRGTQPPESS